MGFFVVFQVTSLKFKFKFVRKKTEKVLAGPEKFQEVTMSKETLRKIAVAIVAAEDSMPDHVKQMIAAGKDRIVRPKEAVVITGRSLPSQYRDGKAGLWPQKYRIGKNAVGYLLSDLLALNASREIVTADNTRPLAPGAKRGRKGGKNGND